MLETAFVIGHASAGAVAFLVGVLAVTRHRALPAHLGSLVLMVIFMIGAVIAGWAGIGTVQRAVYAALVALGGYLVWRAGHARLLASGRRAWDRARYLDDLGFVLIGLFDGFAIVAVLEAGGPWWAAALAGVGGVGVGHLAIERVKRRTGDGPTIRPVGYPGGGASGLPDGTKASVT